MADKLGKNELSPRKKMEDEALELMADLNIAPGDTRLPEMPPVKKAGGVAVKTNIFRVHMDAELPVHQYHVEGRLFFAKRSGELTAWEYTSQHRNDTRAHERTALARQIFVALQLLHSEWMPREDRSVYDGASQLFTLDVLKDGARSIDITVTAAGWPDLQHVRKGAHSVRLSLKRTDHVTQLRHVARALPADIDDNQTLGLLVQFLELATSDKAADAGKHVLLRNGLHLLKEALDAGFTPADLADLPGGGSVARGCRKSARAMGDGAEVAFGLVIDPKVAPMHNVELLSTKVLRQFPNLQNGPPVSAEEVGHFLCGLFFLPVHRSASRPMRVADVTETTAVTQYFEQHGQRTTVQRYFREKYDRVLEHPHLPLVVVKNGDKDTFFPLELCEVAPNQRFATHLFGADVQQRVMAGSTRLPAILERDILNNLRELGLQQSIALSTAHLRVEPQPVEVKARVFDPPTLHYKSTVRPVDVPTSSWKSGLYFRPAEIHKWAMYSLTRAGGMGGNDLTLDQARQFGVAFQNECRRKGMRMTDVDDFRLIEVPPHDFGESQCVKNLLATAQQRGYQFVLVLTGPQDGTIHDTLKYYERKHDVVTQASPERLSRSFRLQNVLSSTAKAAAGIGEAHKRMMMENIVNKTNVKNGGLNFEITSQVVNKQLGARDLFIGISSNMAGGGFRGQPRAPTVIGYAATDKQHPADYTGNYVFQEAQRDEKLQLIAGIVGVALERFRKNRGHAPDRLFVFRNSPTEGSYKHLMRFEIPLVQNVLRKSNADAKLMFVVATRLHPVRLMPAVRSGSKALEQNLKPGTCVDAGITDPHVSEFFLLGHAGKLGTSRVPRYSVLCNEARMSMEDLQRTTFLLCFGHQIIAGTISLPAPLHIADELAKRGRSIFNTAAAEDEEKASITDFNALSERLEYAADSRLRDLRFNA
ncbi:hypothetical protein M3Y99_01451200 [Aphelenchoides fujianensis]|nr:hypothetical protein M3Y99_01451200 [Aphelenchoides fujianensis]